MSEMSARVADLLLWLFSYVTLLAVITAVALLLYGMFFKKRE